MLFISLILFGWVAGISTPALYFWVNSALNSLLNKRLQDLSINEILTPWITIIVWGCSASILVFQNKRYVFKLSHKIRDMIINKVLLEEPESFKTEGKFLSWFLNDAQTIRAGATTIPHIFTYASMTISIALLAVYVNWLTGILMLVGCIFLVLLSSSLKEILANVGLKVSEIKREKTAKISNLLQGQEVFVLSQKLHKFKKLVFQNLTIYKQVHLKARKIEFFLSAISEGVALLMRVFLILIAGWLVYLNYLPIAGFLSFFFFFQPLYLYLSSFITSFVSVFTSTKLLKLFEVSHTKDTLTLAPFEKIELQNVSLSYEPTIKLLENVNFRFEAGKKYAIIGGSGVGKSSLAKLILRSLTAKKGQIFYNDKEYSQIDSSALLEHICFVPANFGVFPATLRENLTLFNNNIEDKTLLFYLEQLNLQHLKLDQIIEDDTISKGEAQRIALVRALSQNKNVFVFDEAFSNLDSHNKVQAEQLFLNDPTKTVINITHHISSTNSYDEIINLGEEK